jgi:pyruvate formate lyase activating enzyme
MPKKINNRKAGMAWMSKPIKEGLIQCLACSHYCKIPKGKTGICGVRYNNGKALELLVYGKAVAVNTDPIEKKPLHHFYPGSEIFSFGTVGCNFRCLFCQNWDISQFHKTHAIEEVRKSGAPLSPRQAVDYCLERGIPSIAFTYNEPGIFFEYAYDTAVLAKKNGLHTVYVSNGFESEETLDEISPFIDAMNIDLKGATEQYYAKICGARLAPVKRNIERLWKEGMWIEVTTLIETNHNDDEKGLTEIAEFLAGVSKDMPWHISRYFPCYQMTDPPTPLSTLEKAAEIGKKAGLRYVYVGNVFSGKLENTYCPKCETLLIERHGYSVQNNLNGDRCLKCDEVIPGRF